MTSDETPRQPTIGQPFSPGEGPRDLPAILTRARELLRSERARASALAHTAADVARQIGDNGALATSLSLLGRIAFAEQGFEPALALHGAALRIAEGTHDPQVLWEVLDGMACLWLSVGVTDEALTLLERALDLEDADPTEAQVAHMHSLLGGAMSQLGRAQEGESRLLTALRLYRQLGDNAKVVETLHNLGCHYGHHGQPAESLARLEEALALNLGRPDEPTRTHTLAELIEARTKVGDVAGALALEAEALEAAEATPRGRGGTRRALARARLERGEVDAAWETVAPLFADETMPDRHLTWELAAEIARARGDLARAEAEAARASALRATHAARVDGWRLKALQSAAEVMRLRLLNRKMEFHPDQHAGPDAHPSLLLDLGWRPGTPLDGARLGFHLAYQLYGDFRTRRIAGCEALLRLQHPRLGPLAPLEFVPHLELTGEIVPVGMWVLEEACRQLGRWSDAQGRAFHMSVNVAPHQLRQEGFAAQVRRLLDDAAVPADRLEIEVTETEATHDSRIALDNLRALSRMGVRLAVDDFGTGFANYARLSDVRFDKLKLDRSLCRRVTRGDRELALLRSILQTAREMGMVVTAEGVETPTEANLLADLGCDYVQGYWLARPRGPREVDFAGCDATLAG